MEKRDYTGRGVEGLEFDGGFVSISVEEWAERFVPLCRIDPYHITDEDYWRFHTEGRLWSLLDADELMDGEYVVNTHYAMNDHIWLFLTRERVPEGFHVQAWDDPGWTNEETWRVCDCLTCHLSDNEVLDLDLRDETSLQATIHEVIEWKRTKGWDDEVEELEEALKVCDFQQVLEGLEDRRNFLRSGEIFRHSGLD